MTKPDHTDAAKRTVGDFVQRAAKTFLVLRCGDVFGVLRDGQPAEFLDPLQPERPVAARAGEHHRQ